MPLVIAPKAPSRSLAIKLDLTAKEQHLSRHLADFRAVYDEGDLVHKVLNLPDMSSLVDIDDPWAAGAIVTDKTIRATFNFGYQPDFGPADDDYIITLEIRKLLVLDMPAKTIQLEALEADTTVIVAFRSEDLTIPPPNPA